MISVRIKDSGGTANGGVDSSPIQQFQITVTPTVAPPLPPAPPPPVAPPPRDVLAVGQSSDVRLYDALTGVQRLAFTPFAGFLGEVSVASGDVNGDGIRDLIVAAGPGGNGHVKVFDGATGSLLMSFFAYSNFEGRVSVAAGDVDGDGKADIVTAASDSDGHVKVFSGITGAEIRSFRAYPGFLGDVSVAAADVDGDHIADIITGAGAGPSGGHVKVFSGATNAIVQSFFAYLGFEGGVRVSAGDLNGDGHADIITGTLGGSPHVKIFDPAGALVGSFMAFDGTTGGVAVVALDVDGDGRKDILAATRSGEQTNLRTFRGFDLTEIHNAFSLDGVVGGIDVG
jgi:hypothetical protein